MNSPDTKHIELALRKTLAWSKAEKYLEYTKHDALNSPYVNFLFGFSRPTRILATQVVMRSPIDIRRLIGVRKSANPKGLALLVMALLDNFERDGDGHDLAEAEILLDELLRLRSTGNWHGDCWGYQYPWQDLGFYATSGTPNAVVTAFVCEAFLRAFQITQKERYLDVVVSASRFFLTDLVVLKSTDREQCLAYMPLPMKMRVMDVSVLIASVLAAVHRQRPDLQLGARAHRLCQYVVNQQSEEGAWYYTDPPEDSPVKIDNYHTGFIVDAILRTGRNLGTTEWDRNQALGVDFYASRLFNSDGSPKWRSDVDFPHDIHGAAQGILTFSEPVNRNRYPDLAAKIMNWALSNMYDETGRFYYQQWRHYTNRNTYLRWCNAWMCRALAFNLRTSPE